MITAKHLSDFLLALERDDFDLNDMYLVVNTGEEENFVVDELVTNFNLFGFVLNKENPLK